LDEEKVKATSTEDHHNDKDLKGVKKILKKVTPKKETLDMIMKGAKRALKPKPAKKEHKKEHKRRDMTMEEVERRFRRQEEARKRRREQIEKMRKLDEWQKAHPKAHRQ